MPSTLTGNPDLVRLLLLGTLLPLSQRAVSDKDPLLRRLLLTPTLSHSLSLSQSLSTSLRKLMSTFKSLRQHLTPSNIWDMSFHPSCFSLNYRGTLPLSHWDQLSM